MKKALAFCTAFVMIFAMAIGFQASAAVKNLLISDDETMEKMVSDAYPPSLDAFDGYTWGSWGSEPNCRPVEDKWIIRDTEVKKFGACSIKVDSKGKLCSISTMYPLKPSLFKKGSTYTLTVYMKTQNVRGDAGALFSIRFMNLDNTNVANGEIWAEAVTGTKDWKRYFITFKVPNANFQQVQLSFGIWGPGSGVAWYDGLSLTEGKTVPADYTALDNPKPRKAPTTTPTSTPKPIEDKPSSWAKAEVDEAVAAKLVPEALQSKYTSSITRSDFCDLVVNMIEVKSGKKIADFVKEKTEKDLSDKPFPDTSSANVNAASKLGIVNGRTNGNFDPSGLITRQEAAKMLALTAKALGADITAAAASFADGAKIADWAKEYVNFVFAKQVMAGTGNNNFSPVANYTREQSILTILRLFKAL